MEGWEESALVDGLNRMRIYILYGFGTLLCIAGIAYLASEYIRYLSEVGKLGILILMIAMFVSFGKWLEDRGF